MKRLALMLWLLPAAALAQFDGESLSGMDSVAYAAETGAAASTATLSAPFGTPGAFASPASIPLGGPVTDVRASSGTYLTGSTMATASSNQLRVGYLGAVLEPTTTNYILQSVDITNAAWISQNSPTLTANTCVGPTGATDLALFNSTGQPTNTLRYQLGLAVSSATSESFSAWFTPQSGSHIATDFITLPLGTTASCSCSVQCLDGSTTTCSTQLLGNSCLANATLSKTCRLSVGMVNTAITSLNAGVGAGVFGSSVDVICAGYGQLEINPFPTSTIVTAGTAASRATETATVPAVGAIGATSGACVWNWTPEYSSSIAGADRVQLSTAGLVAKWVNSSAAVSVTIGGATATTGALAFAANTSHQVRTRWGGLAGAGACVQVDGATEVCGGTYSAITPTNPLYIGGDASGGGGASISGLKCCPGNSPCN